MKQRTLGQSGLTVSSFGLGCMGLSWGYGSADDTQSISVIHRALELGVNFLDTAEVYGPYTNEQLISRALAGKQRDKIIIASKFGYTWDLDQKITGLDSHPKHIRECIEGTLKRLNTDYIDLYYQHRLDPNIPIEETAAVLAELVKAGKVRHIGYCEISADNIRRAHQVHPITAIQSEYSLWCRDVEKNILPTIKELKIGFVPFSPLGRGFLTGNIASVDQLEKSDLRKTLPRFQSEHIKHNLLLVDKVKEIAAKLAITPAQLALAWLLKQGENIVPIPGTKRIQYLEENCQAVNIRIPESDWLDLENFLADFSVEGARYSALMQKMIDQ